MLLITLNEAILFSEALNFLVTSYRFGRTVRFCEEWVIISTWEPDVGIWNGMREGKP